MSPIRLNLPEEAKIIFNALYATDKPSYLTQDLLAIELPGKVFIDVGWYPENNPAGEYQIVVFRDSSDNLLVEPIVSGDLSKVIDSVEALAQRFLPPRHPVVERPVAVK